MFTQQELKKKFADYVLPMKKGVPIAIVEAKANNRTVSVWQAHKLVLCLAIFRVSLQVPQTYTAASTNIDTSDQMTEPSMNSERYVNPSVS